MKNGKMNVGKEILAWLVCFAMVISMIPANILQVSATEAVAETTSYIDENFDTEVAIYTGTSLPSSTTWWRTADTNAILDTENGNIQVTNLRYHMAAAVTENYTLEFKYQLPSGNKGTVTLSNGNPTSATKQVELALTGDGDWHSVIVGVNQEDKTYDLYVDGVIKSTAQAFVNTAVAQTARITFASTNGDMIIDDVKLYAGLPEIEEDPGSDYYIDESFDAEVAIYTGTSLPSSTTWWRTADTNAILDTENGNIQVTNLRYHMAAAVTENYTLEFKYQLPSGNKGTVTLSNGNPTSATKQVELALTGDGDWHSVIVGVNQEDKTYDLYVDGVIKSTAQAFVNTAVAQTARITFASTNGDMIIDDVKLYAGLPEIEEEPTPVEFDVSFDLNYTGAENAPAKITREEGAAYGTLPPATREGYTFGGWYKDASCSGEAVAETDVVTEAHTLYAKWTEVETEPDSGYYIDENFDAEVAIYTGTSLPSSTTWWISATGNATQDLTSGSISVKDLRYYLATPITDNWTMEFEYTLAAGAVAEISLTNGSHGEGNAVGYLRLNGASDSDGGKVMLVGPNITKTLDPAAEETHKLALCYANEKVALYIDGELLTTSAISDGWFDRGSLTKTSVNRVTFLLKSGDSLIIDDVKFYAGLPEIEEEPDPSDAWTIRYDSELGPQIGVTFTGSVSESSGITSVRATLGNASKIVNVEDGSFTVTVLVTAAQMAETITLEALDADEAVVDTRTYTVEGYLNKVKELENGKYSDLVDHTLNYGAYAAIYFGKADVTPPTDLTLVNVPAPASGNPASGTCEGITAKGATLLLKDLVNIRYIFELESGSDINDYTFSIGGEKLTAVKSGDAYYVHSDGINPQEYGEQIVLTVTNNETGEGLTVTYSPLDYMMRMCNKAGTTDKMKDLLKAMYNYHLSALEHMSQNP